jgi:hypothetical protein
MISKMPNWLRWILVIPIAFIADLAAQSIYQLIFSYLNPFEALRPYTDELIWRFFSSLIFIFAGLIMAPKHRFTVACILIVFKSAIALFNIYRLSTFLYDGASLMEPVYITKAPIWWSLLVHILFLSFAIFAIAKDTDIRRGV